MDILWLKDFVSLAALRNFSRAAEDRNVSQPAFSRRIRLLEEDIGVRLINRQTLPLSITPAGEVFLDQARKILRTYDEAVERCQAIDAADDDVVRFATTQSLYLTLYKSMIEPLVNEGTVDIDLNSTTWVADQFVTALQQGYCDVILTYWHPSMDFLAPLEVAKCEYITLATDRLIPLSRANPDGTPQFPIPNTGRKPTPVLTYGTSSPLSQVVDYIMRQQLLPPSVLVVSRNSLAVGLRAMLVESFGMGWLPIEVAKTEMVRGTLVRAGGDDLSADLEIRLYRDSENKKPSLDTLWRDIKSSMR